MVKRLLKAPDPFPPRKAIKRAADHQWPNMSKVSVGEAANKNYTLRKESYLIPYEKAPLDAAGYRHVRLAPPGVLYSLDRKTHEPNGLIQKMPDGLLVAWTHCGICHSHWKQCACTGGVTCGRGIEYIYDSTTARINGERWDYTHPNYLGSLTKKLREQRQNRLDTLTRATARVAPPPKPAPPRRLRKDGQRSPAPAPTPAKSPPLLSADTSKVMRGHKVDHKALDVAAQDQAKELSQITKRMLSKGDAPSPPKRLRRKGQGR